MTIIKNNITSKAASQIKFINVDWIDTEEIIWNATNLRNSYGNLSSFHAIYLDIIKDIQINLLEKIKNNKFDDPFYIACTTRNFVKEIMNDLKNPETSTINKQIAKFKLQNPSYEEKVIGSKLDMHLLYDLIVNKMSNLEDNLRAIAMAKAGKSSFTQNDKNQILDSLVAEIHLHLKPSIFSNNIFGTLFGRIFEGIIKLVIKYIGMRHLDKSISFSKVMLRY